MKSCLVHKFGNYLIDANTSLSGSYNIKNGTKCIAGDAFFNCTKLTNVTIAEDVVSIGNRAFENCIRLTSVTIPDGVTNIGNNTFYGCERLTRVAIPGSVTSIGYQAFSVCTGLTDVYYFGTESQWENISIGSNNDYLKNAKIHYLDISALNGYIEMAKNEVNSGYARDKYSADALDNVKKILSEAEELLLSSSITQSLIDAKATELGESLTTLSNSLKPYTITVVKATEDSVLSTETFTKNYGDTFDYEAKLSAGQSIYKWTKETSSNTVNLSTTSKNISQVVNSDATYTYYISNDVSTDDTAMIKYLDKSGRVIKVEYKEIGNSVELSCEAPSVTFYDFVTWNIISGSVTSLGKDGLVVQASYTFSKSDANKCELVGLNGVKINSSDSYSAYYDEKLTLSGGDNYAFATSDGTITSYITGNVIYAPRNLQALYITAVEEKKASSVITGYIDNNSKLTINAMDCLPDGATIIDTGIVISRSNSTPTINGTNCTKLKSSSQSSAGEFSITMSYKKANSINVRAYMIYELSDGTMKTVYSEVQTISYGG